MSNKYTAIKYRIYPTDTQAEMIQKTIGSARFVYNMMLSMAGDVYKRSGLTLRKFDYNYLLTHVLKEKFPWLCDVDKFALESSNEALAEAYSHFFKGAGFPNYKSKHKSRLSYTTKITGNNISVGTDHIKLPKLKEVKAVIHRIPGNDYKIKKATISYDRSGEYYCSVIFEYESDITPVAVESIEECIGLDFSEKCMYVDNEGNRGNIPSYYRNLQKRLVREQHKLSRMIEANIVDYKVVGKKRYPVYKKPLSECKNIQKQRLVISRIHKHIADQRTDYLHKRSNQITNDYNLICIEDISIRDMMMDKSDDPSAIKRHNINKKTLNNGWYRFTTMLVYKAERKGCTVIKIPKDYPSSQICNCCGYRDPDLQDVSVRKWICPDCKKHHDRDINAAINIRNKGYQIYKEQIA